MLIRDVMTAPAVTVSPRMSVKEALRLLDEHRVTSLPVVDGDGHILGIVSEADLLRDRVPLDVRVQILARGAVQEPPNHVEEVMSTHPMTVSTDADLRDAVELMTSTAVKSIPVVDRGRVVGVVSRSDVVHLLARSDEGIRDEVEDLLRSAGLDCELEVDAGRVRMMNLEDPSMWRVAEVLAGSVAGVVSVQSPVRR